MSEMELFNTEATGIKLFRTDTCPKCEKLKTLLKELNLPFTTMDMQSSEGLTELRFNGVFCLEAPVLQINSKFFTPKQIFSKTELSESFLTELLKHELSKGGGK